MGMCFCLLYLIEIFKMAAELYRGVYIIFHTFTYVPTSLKLLGLGMTGSRGRSFCRSSNRPLGSVLVMFLRARLWPVGACAFHIQPAKRTLRLSAKLPVGAAPPTFVLPSPCATRWFGLHCLQSSTWASPLLMAINSIIPTGVSMWSTLVLADS